MTATTARKRNFVKKKSLMTDEVHVWSVNLNMPEMQVKKLQMYLSTDELQRAKRFYFEKDQNHFIVGRGMLRKILSLYTCRQPYEFVFEYNKYGKPFLPYEFEGDKFRFNLSHSQGIALYAIALHHEVGIDVEYIREDFSDLEIADRFFSPDEVAVLKSISKVDQKLAFFLCWTRKEAFIKGKGRGLSIPLDQFDVSLIPGQPAELLKTKYNHKDEKLWSLYNFSMKPDYAAALAIEGKQKWQIIFREWESNN